MSAAYKCDRCGKLLEGNATCVTISRPVSNDSEFDLCPTCSEKVLMCIKNIDPFSGQFGAFARDLR